MTSGDVLALFAAYGIAAVAGWTAATRVRKERSSTRKWLEQARSLGFTFSPKGPRAAVPGVKVASPRTQNLAEGVRSGVRLSRFEVQVRRGEDIKHILVVRADSNGGPTFLRIRRRTSWVPANPRELPAETRVGSEEFQDAFEVRSADALRAIETLDPSMQAWLLAEADHRIFEVTGQGVYVIGGSKRPEDATSEFDKAIGFVNRLSSATWTFAFPSWAHSTPNAHPPREERSRSTFVLSEACLFLGVLGYVIQFLYWVLPHGPRQPVSYVPLAAAPLGSLVAGYSAKRRLKSRPWMIREATHTAIGLALAWTFIVIAALVLLYHATGCDKPGANCGGEWWRRRRRRVISLAVSNEAELLSSRRPPRFQLRRRRSEGPGGTQSARAGGHER
jgi:hypothetical protein